jgi:CheY-like chemotaxis protein
VLSITQSKALGANVYRQQTHTPTVLVVEDDVIVRIVIADELRLGGFEVIEAGSGPEALAVLSTDRTIDLIFSDIHMPGRINGAALAAIVRDRFSRTRIILCSGSTDGLDLAGIPAVPFVRKPYRPEAVLALVAQLMRGGEGTDIDRSQTGLTALG